MIRHTLPVRGVTYEPRKTVNSEADLDKKSTKKRSIHVVCEHPCLKHAGTSSGEVFFGSNLPAIGRLLRGRKPLRYGLCMIAITMLLQGCIFIAGAAAGAAGIAVVYDHRGINSTIQDMHIANKILEKLRFYPELRNESHIEVSVFNQVVLLTGETPNSEWRQEAFDLAKSVPNVVRVYNQITVQAPISALTRTSDSWITAKLKAQMLTADDLKSGSIKVVTEDGVTYLMGKVSHQQAEIAVDIARHAAGVQRVVRVFQYTN